jgi:hypothetical protein
MAHVKAAIIAALLVLTMAGCATRRDVVASKLRGRGTHRVYAVTVDQAWNISKAILKLEPLDKIEEHRSEGYMLTSDEPASLSPSTYMGVFVEPDGSSSTKVTFVTRRRTPMQGYPALTENLFHLKFGELVALIEAVGPLRKNLGADGGDLGAPCRTLPDAGAEDAGAPSSSEAGASGGP